jgi:hypothetical protein
VARGIERVEADAAFDLEPVALGDPHRDHVDAALGAHHGDAVGAIAQRAQAAHVIGVDVSVDRLHQLELEVLDELQIAIDPVEHRVDDQRLPAAAAADQVRVRRRDRIEQLTEDHAVSGSKSSAVASTVR